ncbi:MAG: hypothetical protein EOO04_30045 [Chitinophagaceae bacterium]|nr:MAG: hypothetical protein EOO04_30045 [Chitinophagaceae bacterium]
MENTIEKNKKALYTPPFRPVYLVGPDQSNEVPLHVTPCFRLSAASSDNFRYHFPEIRTRKGRFVVALDENDSPDQIIQVLMHCVFCDNYLFAGESPVFLFYNSKPEHGRGPSFRRTIKNRLSQQGFPSIVEWGSDDSNGESQFVTGSETDSVSPKIISEQTELDTAWIFEHMLRDFSSLSNYLVFDFDSPRNAVSYEKHIALACESYLQKEPLLSEGLRAYVAQQQQQEALLAENRKLKQQQASDQKTINVIRTKYKDDYENLFKWYHNEYEILPMWYKKIGQLIKVLMGKRTFKSLFSDDVKKYKS